MIPGGRRGVLLAIFSACGLLAAACTQPTGVSGSLAKLQPTEQADPYGGETYLSLGTRLLVAGEPDLAMKAFLSSMSNDGISADAMTGAGIAAQRQGLLTSARRFFVQARDLAPDSVVTHNNLGVVLYRLTEYYAAREEFKTAYALSSGRSEIAERNLNQVEATIDLVEEFAAVDPAVSVDVVRLGSSEFRLEDSVPVADTMAE